MAATTNKSDVVSIHDLPAVASLAELLGHDGAGRRQLREVVGEEFHALDPRNQRVLAPACGTPLPIPDKDQVPSVPDDRPVPSSLEEGSAGAHVSAFQESLNDAGLRLRLPLITVDGYFGHQTRSAYRGTMWALGLLGEDQSAELPVPDGVRALIEDPTKRSSEQVDLARRRARQHGVAPTLEDLLHGYKLLRLIGDWDDWVFRRVETFSFPGEDDTVLLRKRTMDFALPDDLGLGQASFPVPVTFANKWRLPRFDIRDQADNSLPLLSRDEQGRLGVGMLIAFGSLLMNGVHEAGDGPEMPAALIDDLRAIVNEEPDTGLLICDQLGASTEGSDAVELEWRELLVTTPAFMELAYEFARGFLIMVLCSPPHDVRKILKVRYEWPVEPGVKKGRFPARGPVDQARWRRDKPPAACGTLTLSSVCDMLTLGTRQAGEELPCAEIVLTAPDEESATYRLRPLQVLYLGNVPTGSYHWSIRALKGFRLPPGEKAQGRIEVEQGAVARLPVRSQQTTLADRRPSTGVSMAPPVGWLQRLHRGLGWRSKSILLRLRLGDGGSYHMEFEAPPGMQVTRSKLVSDARGEVDIVLRTAQRTHLYVPASLSENVTGFALVTLRTRGETVARSSVLTGIFAALAVAAVALRWTIEGSPGPDGVALLLGVPAALAAYVAQTAPNRVTASLLFGLRATALMPGVLAFLAAGFVLAGDGHPWGLVAMWTVEGLILMVTAALSITLWVAAHPPEQRPVQQSQSPTFVRRYSRLEGQQTGNPLGQPQGETG